MRVFFTFKPSKLVCGSFSFGLWIEKNSSFFFVDISHFFGFYEINQLKYTYRITFVITLRGHCTLFCYSKFAWIHKNDNNNQLKYVSPGSKDFVWLLSSDWTIAMVHTYSCRRRIWARIRMFFWDTTQI